MLKGLITGFSGEDAATKKDSLVDNIQLGHSPYGPCGLGGLGALPDFSQHLEEGFFRARNRRRKKAEMKLEKERMSYLVGIAEKERTSLHRVKAPVGTSKP